MPSPETLRIRFLDPDDRPGGLSDVTAPIHELAALPISSRIVIVCENLESVLALPTLTESEPAALEALRVAADNHSPL